MNRPVLILVPLLLVLLAPTHAAQQRGEPRVDDPAPVDIVIDNFEAYRTGGLPTRWKYQVNKKLVTLEPTHMRPRERFYVVEEPGNKMLRVYTDGEAVHLSLDNGSDALDWDLETHPLMQWDWRALRLPPEAREDRDAINDTGAGIYVFFAFEGFLIKRPKAIKYTYSSTLPVGTVINYGKLKVVVVSSAAEDAMGDWQTITRDVAADYRALFGGSPPRRPLLIRLWGDSDNTNSIAEADFDNIRLLPSS